ncbi:ABC transporter ATP-binding protein [Modestobacter sp. VKM Ac-2984]|uniref:ABC transporter ATP-binding protein n=1 Tax=Modestobacter sp. VKM Ac-2984 TaxID=3004138 RepID=UPI0022AA0407|nr:ATP-binding cassette domain-containing protein [Modestobacter sp. VKM Ac-2984]MCZ2815359.1 ATP-binding cassette domain-containing protein [Modestobacter sp. VKM Ac-2984]
MEGPVPPRDTLGAPRVPGTGPFEHEEVGPATVRLAGFGFRHASRRAWAVQDVDLRIEPGERVLLTGASGSGKSTLLRALGGLLEPESGDATGELSVDGAAPDRRRQRVGVVFQDPDAQLVMTRAGDDVAFGLENTGTPPELIWPAVDTALDAVGFGLGRDHATAALSGGQKQRLVLAGALAPRPGLLLLDEPTAQLDPDGAALVRAAVARAVADRSATLVVVDHDVESWLPLVDRVVELLPHGGTVEHPPGWRPAPLRVPVRWVHPPGEVLLAGEAAGFTHRGGARPALAPTDVALRAGRTLAVTGPNGTGKSTLALLLAGLRAPTTGRVVAAATVTAGLRRPERPPHRWPAAELATRIGTVFQQPEHQFLTGRVRDELALGPLRSGAGAAQARATAEELLERLGLAALADANPFTLSGGQQRRLSVATALATSPRVLVLDEPTFGQDRETWAELVALLAEQQDGDRALCLVTHDAAVVTALADDVCTLGAPVPG